MQYCTNANYNWYSVAKWNWLKSFCREYLPIVHTKKMVIGIHHHPHRPHHHHDHRHDHRHHNYHHNLITKIITINTIIEMRLMVIVTMMTMIMNAFYFIWLVVAWGSSFTQLLDLCHRIPRSSVFTMQFLLLFWERLNILRGLFLPELCSWITWKLWWHYQLGSCL